MTDHDNGRFYVFDQNDYEMLFDGKEEDEPCLDTYSANGLCPCCGAELVEENPQWASPGFVQICNACNYMSDVLYDL